MNALTALYPEKVKTGEYAFKGVNLDEPASKALAKKLKVGGQSLLVVCDLKQIDLTTKVFLYAQDQTKIKAEIKKAVERVLSR
jgi:ABC-type enterochelin transport system ATPase subunit